jgi:hypothetical protein
MSLRFQADADFNETILRAVWRREPGLDVQTAEAAGLRGLSDPEVLALAARDGRVLIGSTAEAAEWSNTIRFLPL